MAQAMVRTGSRQRNRTPYSSSLPTRGGSGSAARWRPSSVSLSRPASKAPMSCPQSGQHKHGSDVKGVRGTTVRYVRPLASTMGIHDREAAGDSAANTGSADELHVDADLQQGNGVVDGLADRRLDGLAQEAGDAARLLSRL